MSILFSKQARLARRAAGGGMTPEKPRVLPVKAEGVPDVLQALPRWVVWRLEWRADQAKWTKTPYQARRTDCKASSTNARSWSTFAEAVRTYARGHVDGIGITLGPLDDDGRVLAGMDFDKLALDDTGTPVLDIQERRWLSRLATYTELSPSGRGVHAIAFGHGTRAGLKRGRHELYFQGRYLTMTGHVFGDTCGLRDADEALHAIAAELDPPAPAPRPRETAGRAALEDEALLVRARQASNGDRFRDLFDHGCGPGGPSEDVARLLTMLAFWTDRDGARMDRLFRRSALFTAHYTTKWDDRRGDTTWGAREIARACARVADTYQPGRRVNGTPRPSPTPHVESQLSAADRLTEAGAAERFARLHGDDVRYDHRRSQWLLWEGHRWAPDLDGGITRLAIAFSRTWQREAVEIPDPKARALAFTAAVRLERRDALRAMLALAADLAPITDAGRTWDLDPWLLGAANGVIDVRTGRLRDGRREDRITLQVAVPFDAQARSTLWTAAVQTILVVPEKIQFLQTALGYSTTGDMRRDCWFLSVGNGRNGKGTLFSPVRRVLGDYAAELPASVLDARRDAPPYDLAVLPGKRFVVSSEAGDSLRLHHDRVKQLTGGDGLRAAAKYEHSVEFTPTCKLWLSANKKPTVTDDTDAFWARVLLVPFTESFVGREDRNLRPTLEHDPAHQAAILAWLVAGAVRYAAEGLEPPATVQAATRAYAEESDILAEFIAEACERMPAAVVRAAELYAHYRTWASHQGYQDRETLTATAFGRRMGAKFAKRHAETGVVYAGIARRGIAC